MVSNYKGLITIPSLKEMESFTKIPIRFRIFYFLFLILKAHSLYFIKIFLQTSF